MISKELRKKIIGVILDNDMIPEHTKMINKKKELEKNLEEFIKSEIMTKKDMDLMKKYPNCVAYSDKVSVCRFYNNKPLSDESLVWENYRTIYDTYSSEMETLTLKLSEKLPIILSGNNDTLMSLRFEKDNIIWKKFGEDVVEYLGYKSEYYKKFDKVYEFLSHKNTTLTLIKNGFPELYRLIKS